METYSLYTKLNKVFAAIVLASTSAMASSVSAEITGWKDVSFYTRSKPQLIQTLSRVCESADAIGFPPHVRGKDCYGGSFPEVKVFHEGYGNEIRVDRITLNFREEKKSIVLKALTNEYGKPVHRTNWNWLYNEIWFFADFSISAHKGAGYGSWGFEVVYYPPWSSTPDDVRDRLKKENLEPDFSSTTTTPDFSDNETSTSTDTGLDVEKYFPFLDRRKWSLDRGCPNGGEVEITYLDGGSIQIFYGNSVDRLKVVRIAGSTFNAIDENGTNVIGWVSKKSNSIELTYVGKGWSRSPSFWRCDGGQKADDEPLYDNEGFRILGPKRSIKMEPGYREKVKINGRGRIEMPFGGYCVSSRDNLVMEEPFTTASSASMYLSPPEGMSSIYTNLQLLNPSDCNN